MCHSRSCLARGSEAVLREIEELVDAAGGGCVTGETGCLGYCRSSPAALVILPTGPCDPSDPFPKRAQVVHSRIDSLDKSLGVVERALGRKIKAEVQKTGRNSGLRGVRARSQARASLHWNRALAGLADEVLERPALAPALAELLRLAGFPPNAGVPALNTPVPEHVDSYTEWLLGSRTPVSRHSAVYHFSSSDVKRGTMHPRGGGRRRPQPCTWHTVLIAPIGANKEGPLPWVERDYTPISTAADWEAGRADILIKVYPHGRATQWLHRETPPCVRLSHPVRTLGVPTLVPNGGGGYGGGYAFDPASVLLFLAGTGVVALPQVLAHRDPVHKLSMSTPARQQLRVPIDAILSFKEDDVLLLPELVAWCHQHVDSGDECAGLRRCSMFLTSRNEGAVPFPGIEGGDAPEAEAKLSGLTNATVTRARLSAGAVAEAARRMPEPCRAVISGPAGFNSAVREMLARVLDEDQITVLSA